MIYDIDEELLEAEYDEIMLNKPNKRGRAYKRVQRRNHIEKRKKMAKDIYYLPPNSDDTPNGHYAKMHCGCNRAKCKICHWSKIFNLPTVKEMKFKDKMREELAEIAS